jgi:hypothetical protein
MISLDPLSRKLDGSEAQMTNCTAERNYVVFVRPINKSKFLFSITSPIYIG